MRHEMESLGQWAKRYHDFRTKHEPSIRMREDTRRYGNMILLQLRLLNNGFIGGDAFKADLLEMGDDIIVDLYWYALNMFDRESL
jgi:hypothetical protein